MANEEIQQASLKEQSGSQPPTPVDAMIGTTIAERYRIVELIGAGGFGNVYRGKHLTLGTDIAVKVIHPLLSADPARQQRFEREARSLSQIDSQYVVKTIDYVPAPVPCIIMEFFPGKTLDQVVSPDKPLSPAIALQIFNQLCEGLKAAHALGFIHRDLKPSNILVNTLDTGVTCKILDFGIAKTLNEDSIQSKLTGTGELIGSPPYMSPEQWCGRRLDARSDIYSLGCVMYETLVGRPPFIGEIGTDLLHQHMFGEPPTFSKVLPGTTSTPLTDLEKVIRKCMAKSVDDRYSTVADLQQDLNSIASGKRVTIKLRKTSRQPAPSWMPWVAAAVAAIVGGGGVYLLLRPKSVSHATPPAKVETIEKVSGYANYGNELSINQAFAEMETNPEHAQQLIVTALNNTPPEHRNTVPYSTWTDLYAQVLLKHGNLDKAQQYEEKALALAQKLLPPDDTQICDRLNNLAEIMRQEGKYADSEKLFKQVIAINSKSHKRGLVPNYNLLGLLYLDEGRNDEAAACFQKAYDTYTQYISPKGGEHFYYNVGMAYEKSKNYPSSAKAFRRAIQIARENGTDQKPRVAGYWSALSDIYLQLGDNRHAEECLEQAIKMRELGGAKPGQLLPLYNALIEVKQKLGKNAEARALSARLHN